MDAQYETREVLIPADGPHLPGTLAMPPGALGLVLFAHGSGSSRHSPRNRYVATQLNRIGIGTLLMDLLTPQEDSVATARFDIDLLAARLAQATTWTASRQTARLPLVL